MIAYTPHPLDTDAVELPDELLKLTELLAKNTHDIWAQQRLSEGWKYGQERNDTERLHPCLVPYEYLSETEKEYDRNTAMGTLKAIKKLGFKITK